LLISNLTHPWLAFHDALADPSLYIMDFADSRLTCTDTLYSMDLDKAILQLRDSSIHSYLKLSEQNQAPTSKVLKVKLMGLEAIKCP